MIPPIHHFKVGWGKSRKTLWANKLSPCLEACHYCIVLVKLIRDSYSEDVDKKGKMCHMIKICLFFFIIFKRKWLISQAFMENCSQGITIKNNPKFPWVFLFITWKKNVFLISILSHVNILCKYQHFNKFSRCYSWDNPDISCKNTQIKQPFLFCL